MVANLLPRGKAIGVDLWKSGDQSGNALSTTERNTELEGVAERVELHTADMRKLPFADNSFARLCTFLLNNRPHKQAEKEWNWGLKPHQDQWVMWEKRNCPTDAASRLPRHHETSLLVCD